MNVNTLYKRWTEIHKFYKLNCTVSLIINKTCLDEGVLKDKLDIKTIITPNVMTVIFSGNYFSCTYPRYKDLQCQTSRVELTSVMNLFNRSPVTYLFSNQRN